MNSDRDAVIIDLVRTPLGRGGDGGLLSGVHPADLLAQTLRGLLDRSGIDPSDVEDVITDCVGRANRDDMAIGRMARLAVGLPARVPSTTMNHLGVTSQQAASFAGRFIMQGIYDAVIVAGIESSYNLDAVNGCFRGTSIDLSQRYSPSCVPPRADAESIVEGVGISREAMDRYSVRSHQRAGAVASAGEFDREIIPIRRSQTERDAPVLADEMVNARITADRLGQLPSLFGDAEEQRFSDFVYSLTSGNSAQPAAGAAAMLIMSARRADQLGLIPRARFRAFAVAAGGPALYFPGLVSATERVLDRAGLSINQMDHFEIDEVCAYLPLAWQAVVGGNDEFLNPRGGALALGYPLGASGIRMMTTMLTALEDTGGRYGLQAICEAGDLSIATIIERV